MKARAPFAIISILLVGLVFLVSSTKVHADDAAIQTQIDQHNASISSLQADIAAYQKQLNTLGGQKQTLRSALQVLELSREKTAAQLTITQNQVAAANLNLQKLGVQISNKQQSINLDKRTLGESIRQIDTTDHNSFLVTILSADNLVSAWTNIDTQLQLNAALQSHMQNLNADTVQLNGQQQQVTGTKTKLVTLDTNLTTQQGQINATAASKKQLLAQTNSKESSYQSLIAQKKAQEASFESELNTLQNSLKNVSSSLIPKSGSGILAWPFSTSEMAHCPGLKSALGNPFCITQYFGNTAFATANASVYSGMGHDGLDIGVPVGTPVEAALNGTVLGTGNTDLSHNSSGAQCYSFGKWVMLAHANGLNTMYAHLSVINVSKGQSVSQGDIIGYSGMTGYATGPHLHFGVYASSGVQIITLNQFRGATTPCANATMPVAPSNAYLNPLSYLP
jgi:murein DD-endopeptidase MepM/ murein hydrolase activator NlpD